MSPVAARTNELIDELARTLPGRVSTTPPDRVAYARECGRAGCIACAAATPRPTRPTWSSGRRRRDEVQAIVRAGARAAARPIVPFGAGSGVCGGTLPMRGGIASTQAHGASVLDASTSAATARSRPGIIGERLERELDAPRLHARPLSVVDHVLDARRLAGGALRRAALDAATARSRTWRCALEWSTGAAS